MNKSVKRTVYFFLLAFGVSWLFWIGLYRSGMLSERLALLLGTWGPTTAALVVTAVDEGRKGLRDLFKKLLIWRVHSGWYFFVLFAAPIVVAIALIMYIGFGGELDQANDPSQWYLVFPGLAQIFFLSVLGEELGWRGYALPQLQRRFGLLWASLIIGILWGVWHIPLWWMESNFHSQIPFYLFLLENIALSVVITWVYTNTKGSILLVSLFHAASNLTIGVAPLLPEYTGGSLIPLYISLGILCIGAGLISVRFVRAPV